MKNPLLIFLSIVFFLGCKTEKKELSNELKNTELYVIDFLEEKIWLPNHYDKSSIEELFTIVESYTENGFTKFQNYRWESLKDSGSKFQIFTEKDNYFNSISFVQGQYIPLDREAVPVYVSMLETQVLPKSKEFGIDYKRLESKFLKYGNTTAIKVKYIQTANNQSRYFTQYIITYKLQTFAIVVINSENTDFQFILKNFRS